MSHGLTIETRNLTKHYGNFTAVDRLNLRIDAGDSYGFLGPNGAGKTTTLMMILGLLQPSEGEVFIDGELIASDAFEIKRRIGFVPEYQTFYEEMSAWEYLLFFGEVYGVTFPEKHGRRLLEHLGLWEWRDVLISGFSNGMKRKLGFARAMIHSPDLLILDEPIAGLDPMGIIQVRELLLAERKRGCTLLISSHILSEVEKTVDTVGILSGGKLVWQNPMADLQHWVSGKQEVRITLARLDDETIAAFNALPFVQHVTVDGNSLRLVMDSARDYREDISRFIFGRKLVLLEMKEEKTTLEEAFVRITEKHLHSLPGANGDTA